MRVTRSLMSVAAVLLSFTFYPSASAQTGGSTTGFSSSELREISCTAAVQRVRASGRTERILSLAEARQTDAMLIAGWLADPQCGIGSDRASASTWYHRAARAGSVRAMRSLGSYYLDERAPNEFEAVQWYRRAAEAGDAESMNQIGLFYRDGLRGRTTAASPFPSYGGGETGVVIPRDVTQAYTWFRRAADIGNAWAMVEVGYMHETGRGARRDGAEAVRWYRSAADRGNGMAMNNLGVSYRDGIGVPRDESSAVAWFRRGAAAGELRAMTHLGWMLEWGIGTERNLAEARQWYRRAAENGDTNAREILRDFGTGRLSADGSRRILTNSARDEAMRQYDYCIATHPDGAAGCRPPY